MIRLIPALACLALTAAPAASATLRADALVSGEVVTVGDLIDDAGDRASVGLFRAPDPGQTGAVPASVVLDAARRAGLADVSAGGVVSVEVTRAARRISADEVRSAIAGGASAATDAPSDAFDVTLDDRGAIDVDAAATGALTVARFVSEPRTGRFEATLDVAGRSRLASPLKVSGTVVEMVEAPTLTRPLARGEVIAKADLKLARLPKAQAGDAVLADELVGLAAKRALRDGQPLKSGDLMRPQHVERGSFITLVYANDGVSLSLKAKALGAGAAGDIVAVQNIQSKRVVNGVVTGPSEVTVTAAATAVARR